MGLGYVVDEATGLIKTDSKGLPLVVDTSKEGDEPYGLDGIGLMSKVPALQKESKDRRMELKEARQQLENFQSLEIDDIDSFKTWKSSAAKAMELVKNLDDKKLFDANKVEEMKNKVREESAAEWNRLKKQYEESLKEKDESLKLTANQIRELVVDNKFHATKYIPEGLNISPKVARKLFGENFKVEVINGESRAVGYLNNEPIMSRSNIGETASFEEALRAMVDADSERDTLIKVEAQKTKNDFAQPFVYKSAQPEPVSATDKIRAGLEKMGLKN